MIEFELQQLQQNVEWRLVLEAYRRAQDALRERDPEGPGWTSRVKQVEDVKSESLPRIHGKLIALGLLKFQLEGRTSGVQYQVSRLGRQALNRLDEQDRQDDPQELARTA